MLRKGTPNNGLESKRIKSFPFAFLLKHFGNCVIQLEVSNAVPIFYSDKKKLFKRNVRKTDLMNEGALFQIWQKDFLSNVLSEMFWNCHGLFPV